MKKFTFILVLLLACFISHTQVNLDSLWNIWNDNNVPDTSRALALKDYAWDGYLFSQPDSAFYFAQILYDFANKKNLRKDMAMAKKIQGASCFIQSDYPKALDFYQQSLTISKEISDKSGIASNLGNIGLIYERKSNFLKALDYQQRCLKMKEEISDTIGIAGTLNNIGNIYKNLDDYSNAKEYYERSFILLSELSHKSGMAISLNNLGLVYKNLGNYAKALEYYHHCLKVNEERPDKRAMAHNLNNIGNVYTEQGDYSKALEYYKQSLNVKEEISDKRGIINTLNNIGKTYNKQGDYNKSIEWCKKGLSISEELNILEEKKIACECLYNAYKSLGHHGQALIYHERTIALNDSLQLAQTSKKLQQMEFAKQVLADSLKREGDKLITQMTNEREIRNKNRTRNIFLVIAFLLFGGAFAIYRRVHFVRKAKKAIEKEKVRSDKLLHNILPSKIAEELKLKGKADAKNFDKVTILFSNFKGFARISEKLSAEELVEEINSCFEPFDEICRKYGIEKIKTIGDAYMAAGGIPVPSDSAVKDTVLAGLEMMSCINNKKNEKKLECQLCFEMQIGIHTGPAVAGIVGTSKFHYDIWGDAVNTASRIEDAGEVSKVNISHSTYKLIKDDKTFKFEQRGKIMTKGKGEIDMWFVEKVG